MLTLNRVGTACVLLGVLLGGSQAQAKAPSKVGAYKAASLKSFYFFGEEPFESFTCGLKVDVVEMLIKGLEEQFKAANLPLVITENIDTFQVTFTRKTDDATFVEPSLSVTIKPGSEVKDPAQIEAGVQQIEAGFKGAVVGAVQIVRGAFDEYEQSRFAKYSDVRFKANDSGYDATFTKDGAVVQESFSGKVRRMTFQMGGQTVTSKSSYKRHGEKGLLVSEAELIPGPGTRLSISFEYQTVQGLLIPKTLRVHSRQEIGGQVAENRVGVTLERCTVRR
ncbi:MAG: hypothetical protein ACPGU1_03125 [Myxococcota bacterium]